jgi:predicted DNA-binding protein
MPEHVYDQPVWVRLPVGVVKLLDKWAEGESRSRANLLKLIVEKAITEEFPQGVEGTNKKDAAKTATSR